MNVMTIILNYFMLPYGVKLVKKTEKNFHFNAICFIIETSLSPHPSTSRSSSSVYSVLAERSLLSCKSPSPSWHLWMLGIELAFSEAEICQWEGAPGAAECHPPLLEVKSSTPGCCRNCARKGTGDPTGPPGSAPPALGTLTTFPLHCAINLN